MGQITQENSYVDWRVYTECLDLIDNPERTKYNYYERDIIFNGSGLLFEVQQELYEKFRGAHSKIPMWICFDKPIIYQDFGEIIVELCNSEAICSDSLYDHNEAIAYIQCENARSEIIIPNSLLHEQFTNCKICLRFTMCLYKEDKHIYKNDINVHNTYFEAVCELLKSKIEQKLKELA